VVARLLEFGLRWPRADEECDWWDEMISAVETEPMDGPLHRARNPKDWHWYVPGYNEQVTLVELTATANWQRAGGKGIRPKPAKRPWDKKNTQRKITPDKGTDTDEYLKWLGGRFAKA
jgi:hypothetical protein